MDINGTSSDFVPTPAVNDAPDTNDVALLSEEICVYLANDTHKRAFKKDRITMMRVYVFKYTPQCTANKVELLDKLKKQVET